MSTRRALAPDLRDRPGIAFGAVGLLLLLFIAWGPIAATRSWLGILVMVALSLLGVQMLRLQTAAEFPDARAGEGLRLGSRAAAAAGAAAGAIAKASSDLRGEVRAARSRRRGEDRQPTPTPTPTPTTPPPTPTPTTGPAGPARPSDAPPAAAAAAGQAAGAAAPSSARAAAPSSAGAAAPPSGGAGAAPTPAAEDLAGQLERLARLHSDGSLTEEEYAAAKRRLLRSRQ